MEQLSKPENLSDDKPPVGTTSKHVIMDDKHEGQEAGVFLSADLDIRRAHDWTRRPESKYPVQSSYENNAQGINHENLKLLREAYTLIKGGGNPVLSPEVENKILELKCHMGNTVLHGAAMHGKHHLVEKIAHPQPQPSQEDQDILTAKNGNGDTALHLAAKFGHKETVNKLLVALLSSFNFPLNDTGKKDEAKERILMVNKKGNTFLHEALLNRHEDVVNLVFHDEQCSWCDSDFKYFVKRNALAIKNKENKSILYLAIQAGYKNFVEQALAKVLQGDNFVPPGESFFLAAIFKKDRDMLESILTWKPEWIHLMDTEGRTVLHYAASTGYVDGVQYLLKMDSSCASAWDKNGYLPVHLASDGGHVEIVQKLLEDKYCPYLREMLDNNGRNILHLAIQSGKINVVRYILQSTNHELQEMINEKDCDGNTPLHLASLHAHPKIVHTLTWDKRVKLNSTNNKDKTALDVCQKFSSQNPSFQLRLTWSALKSAGVKYGHQLGPYYIKVHPQTKMNSWDHDHRAPNMDQYKDRVNTLMLVSTLIVTVTYAAGFTLPDGTDSSDERKVMAFVLNYMWFKVYIFCITVSMYGALSVIIILIWAQFGDLTLTILALKLVKPILGVTLATLSLAFMAGLHLVICDLKWLATTTFALCVIFILTLLFLYTLLWYPSPSRKIVVRYISYYPFLFLASLVDCDETSGKRAKSGLYLSQV